MPGTTLDHVAVAVERWTDAFPRYRSELGGIWSSGGRNVGFSPCQIRYANDARLELLQPWDWQRNDFLRRFLDSNGPGPHHVTFKVDDIVASLDAVRAAGFDPVGENFDDPGWLEAFLHPRQACGIVVQLAQADDLWASPPPPELPSTDRSPATLLRAVHAVADLDRALGLFGDLLDARTGPRRAGPDSTWEAVDLSWRGPLGMRLVAPTSAATSEDPLGWWLRGRAGRLHHLVFELPVADATPVADRPSDPQAAVPGVFDGDGPIVEVVEPPDNLGVRLVLLSPGRSLDA